MVTKGSVKRLLSIVMSLCLASVIVGCEKKASPNPTKQIGDDYFGYLTVPENWIDAMDDWLDIAGSADIPIELDFSNMSRYAAPNDDVTIVITVSHSQGMRELLFGLKDYHESKADVVQKTINLDNGAITPVNRCSFRDPDDGTFVVEYILEGSDGLARSVMAYAKSEELVKQGVTIIESTYTFKGNPPVSHDERPINPNTIEPQIVVDQDGVTITFLSLIEGPGFMSTPDGQGAVVISQKMGIQVENNRQEEIVVTSESLSLDGVLVNQRFKTTVEAGDEAFCYIIITPEAAGLEYTDTLTINEIELCFRVVDSTTGETIFVSDIINISTLVDQAY